VKEYRQEWVELIDFDKQLAFIVRIRRAQPLIIGLHEGRKGQTYSLSLSLFLLVPVWPTALKTTWPLLSYKSKLFCEINCGLCVSSLVKVKAVPLHAKQAQRGGRVIVLYIFDAGARKGWVVIVMPWPFYRRERHQAPIAQEIGWALGPVWIVRQNPALTGFRAPDRSARSESQTLLSFVLCWQIEINVCTFIGSPSVFHSLGAELNSRSEVNCYPEVIRGFL
jgi:hypothetical protein